MIIEDAFDILAPLERTWPVSVKIDLVSVSYLAASVTVGRKLIVSVARKTVAQFAKNLAMML